MKALALVTVALIAGVVVFGITGHDQEASAFAILAALSVFPLLAKTLG